mmetsp:Transcript_15799/g.31745  ORF Transcript_15799/g.31745 Transcript_15799/m.31745 type:complete len:199 (-) Transcript_15799:2139-2735(-)
MNVATSFVFRVPLVVSHPGGSTAHSRCLLFRRPPYRRRKITPASLQEDGTESRSPNDDDDCPCGSRRGYGRCCGRFHRGIATPRTAVELLRARFSAYAARLPLYIMKTTHIRNEDYSADRKAWKRSILEFCDRYSFRALALLETRIVGPTTTYLLFRASLSNRGRFLSFIENGKFVLDRGTWYYIAGKLVSVEDESNF